jgi:TRAP transporter TAXI family solute receptor
MKEKARQRKDMLCAAAIFFLAMTFFGFLYPTFSLAQPKSARSISIATGGTGGVYYVVGGGIAAVISKYLPGVQANAEVTAAAVDNCKLIMSRQVDMAFCNGDVAYDAYAGLERFKATGKVPVRALAVLYSSPFHVATLEGAGIDKVADLKGKRVSTGAPGSGAEIIALRILEAAGLDPSKDIRRERLSVAECASAVRDRKIDAAFVGALGLPAAAVLDLASAPGIKMKLIPHDEVLEKITKKYGPSYVRVVIPKGTYPGMTQPVPVIAVATILLCHGQLEERMGYELVKAIFEHRDDLKLVHKEAENITLESAVLGSSVPYHPGAVKYYQEKGVWPK